MVRLILPLRNTCYGLWPYSSTSYLLAVCRRQQVFFFFALSTFLQSSTAAAAAAAPRSTLCCVSLLSIMPGDSFDALLLRVRIEWGRSGVQMRRRSQAVGWPAARRTVPALATPHPATHVCPGRGMCRDCSDAHLSSQLFNLLHGSACQPSRLRRLPSRRVSSHRSSPAAPADGGNVVD